MSDQGYVVNATARKAFGKAHTRRTRREAAITGVIYGAGKEVEHVFLDANQITKLIEEVGFHSHILDLSLGGKKQKVILKAFQRQPGHSNILHMDFMRVSMKEKLTMTVPLHFVGSADSKGVKEGGEVTHSMTELEVRCMPTDLPEQIEADLSGLEMDQVFHLADVVLPEGVELTVELGEEYNPPVATVRVPRVEVIEEAPEVVEGEEGEGSEAAEGDAAEGGGSTDDAGDAEGKSNEDG